LSRFEELSRREAARTAILYAFDLIELDGEGRIDAHFASAGAGATGLFSKGSWSPSFDFRRRRRPSITGDLRNLPFLDRKAALARLLRDAKAGILHVAEDGPTVFDHACRLNVEGIVSKKVDGTCRSGPSRA
jgi:ATP-dependent DNA ligase